MPLKAIIVAAGFGSRLGALTSEQPKFMLPVGGQPILSRAKTSLAGGGVRDFVVVNGYLSETCPPPAGFRVYTNHDFRDNNILESLFYAETELDGEVIVAYGDLVYTAEMIKALVAAKGDIRVLIEPNWHALYQGRDQNPFTDAELCCGNSKRLTAIGKGVADNWNCCGEFTGIAYLSAAGCRAFSALYHELRRQYREEGREFLNGAPFRKAYLSHFLHEMILRGAEVVPVNVSGPWVEIDTRQDYDRALRVFAPDGPELGA